MLMKHSEIPQTKCVEGEDGRRAECAGQGGAGQVKRTLGEQPELPALTPQRGGCEHKVPRALGPHDPISPLLECPERKSRPVQPQNCSWNDKSKRAEQQLLPASLGIGPPLLG